MYAIIEEGGKQFKVTTGDRLLIDRPFEEGAKTLSLDRVLLIGGEGAPKIGTPVLAGASVEVDVLGAEKGAKIDIYKYKRRKGYHKRQGHRQNYTAVKVTAIKG